MIKHFILLKIKGNIKGVLPQWFLIVFKKTSGGDTILDGTLPVASMAGVRIDY